MAAAGLVLLVLVVWPGASAVQPPGPLPRGAPATPSVAPGPHPADRTLAAGSGAGAGADRGSPLPGSPPRREARNLGPNPFRVRLTSGDVPAAGAVLRAWVNGRVWLGDATCDEDGVATFPDARGLQVRVAPAGDLDHHWEVELGSATHEPVPVRLDQLGPATGAVR